jgi:hydrogenase maturation protease
MSPSKWLVLGLGNPLAGADGFGPAVIEHLDAAGGLPAGVELIDAHTDLLGHLDEFAERDHVILVDAMLSADRSGIATFSEATFSTWDERSTGAHGMSAVMAVKLFRRLQEPGRSPQPRITLVALLVSEADFHLPLEPHVIGAGAEAVRSALV